MKRLFLLACFIPSVTYGFDGPGTTGSPFLKIPLSARATAMSGAFSGLSGDAALIDYNPAGLADMRRVDIQINYLDYLEDTSLQSLVIGNPITIGAAPPLEPLEGVEFSQNKIYMGLEYRSFQADDTARSEFGVQLDDFKIRDQQFALGFAYPFAPRISLGVSGKYISSEIQGAKATSYAFDGGVLGKISSRWSVGAAVQNLGSSDAFEAEADPLPTLVRGGVAYKSGAWLLAADLAGGSDGVMKKSGGAEWTVNRLIAFRGGVSHDTTLQLSGGLGLRIQGPKKSAPPAYRPPSSNASKTGSATSGVAHQLMTLSVDKLTKQYNQNVINPDRKTITVLPIESRDRSAAGLSKMVEDNLAKKKEFVLVRSAGGQIPNTDLMITSTLDRKEGKYGITTRLIQREDAEILATDYVEIAMDDLPQGQTLGGRRESVRLETTIINPYDRVEIGLDYGLATREDLGIAHNLTLRILY